MLKCYHFSLYLTSKIILTCSVLQTVRQNLESEFDAMNTVNNSIKSNIDIISARYSTKEWQYWKI